MQALFETISSAAAFLVFVVGWLSYQRRAPFSVALLAVTFLGVALLGLGYLVSGQYTSEPGALFGAETAPLFWMSARLFAVVGVTLAVMAPWRTEPASPASRKALLTITLVLVGGLYSLILLGHDAAQSYIQSTIGISALTDGILYFATALYLLNTAALWQFRRAIPNIDNRSMTTALVFIVLASIGFGLQGAPNDTFNLLGHAYKLCAYYYLYRAVVISDIETPYVELDRARSRLEATLETLPDVILELDDRGIVHQIHSSYPHLLEAPEAVIDHNLFDCLPEQAARSLRRLIADIEEHGRSRAHDFSMEVDGERRDFEATGNSLSDPRNRARHYIVIIQDVTERKRLDHELRIAAAAFESQESICITDGDHRILRVNSAFTRITGFEQHEMIGRDPSLLLPEDDRNEFRRRMDERMEHRSRWRGEIRIRRKNGEVHSQLLLVTAVRGEQGRVRNFIYDYIDISELKKAETRIQQLALYDPLTGLGNRTFFDREFEKSFQWCQRHQQGFAVAMVDADLFKQINDTHGHDVGDQCLKNLARLLREHFRRDTDRLSRFGGEEFVLFASYREVADIIARLEGFREAVAAYHTQKQKPELRLTVSIGLAHGVPGPDSVPADYLRLADQALYRAKHNGRNRLETAQVEER